MKRILDPDMPLKDQLLVLVPASTKSVEVDIHFEWSDYDNRDHVERLLEGCHVKRLAELFKDGRYVQLLPPGSEYVTTLLRK